MEKSCFWLFAAPVLVASMLTVPRSRRLAASGDLLDLNPGEPVLADVCVTQPLADSHVSGAAKADGPSTTKSEAHTREKYGRCCARAFPFVPIAHETYGRVGPAAFAFFINIAAAATSSSAVLLRVFLE